VKRRTFLWNLAATGLTVGAGGALITGDGDENAAAAGVGLRPPGALPEEEFLSRCIRCFRCGDACPNRAIVALNEVNGADFSRVPRPAERGTPVIFPRRQACMLCIDVKADELRCTAACPSGALRLVKREPDDIQAKVHMGEAQVDTNICYSYNGASCGVCVRACPFEGKALRATLFERPVLDPTFCVGCGLCERACIRYPQAISVQGTAS
jgi:MauM/NapG family ferredoxin protein